MLSGVRNFVTQGAFFVDCWCLCKAIFKGKLGQGTEKFRNGHKLSLVRILDGIMQKSPPSTSLKMAFSSDYDVR